MSNLFWFIHELFLDYLSFLASPCQSSRRAILLASFRMGYLVFPPIFRLSFKIKQHFLKFLHKSTYLISIRVSTWFENQKKNRMLKISLSNLKLKDFWNNHIRLFFCRWHLRNILSFDILTWQHSEDVTFRSNYQTHLFF